LKTTNYIPYNEPPEFTQIIPTCADVSDNDVLATIPEHSEHALEPVYERDFHTSRYPPQFGARAVQLMMETEKTKQSQAVLANHDHDRGEF